ncbi:ADP-ribosylglycohydrolase family protein [Pelagibius sp. Alg239-R121]|uniref:ADP-ribosylglycohydrolase family protein n=1 Tax=Pelagibius sp. Alg239-R121 TaxID=2993448 RepID=UPI0024A624C3|nr:ADP-ribosylglycohydrolase family protein [Pelagibius sp. Alg239-R121]
MVTASDDQRLDRALGALIGGALGDALGMPTQLLSPGEIAQTYGYVDDFVAPTADHPVSKGLPAGAITDDTEQTLLLARVLLNSTEGFDHAGWIEALVEWERDVRARGSLDLLGPSTKRAIEAIKNGASAEEAGSSGDTNGAAMRIAPVGIMAHFEPLEDLIERVADTCRATHNTSVAIASAAAVAAAVSYGVAGGDWRAASLLAIEAADRAAGQGHWIAGADIAARIKWARDLVSGCDRQEAITLVVDLVGTSVASQESVPAAFAILEIAQGDPWQAAVIGANVGGDTDTIGAIAAGMAGACTGLTALPSDKIARLKGINSADVRQLAADLLAVRPQEGEREPAKAGDTDSNGKDAA